MDEREWLTSTDPQGMFQFLVQNFGEETIMYDKGFPRKVRLFACICCRRIWHLLTTERSRRAVEVAERYADRQLGTLSLLAAGMATLFHQPHAPEHIGGFPASLILFTRSMSLGDAAGCAGNAVDAVSRATPDNPEEARKAESTMQAALLREIFGNPFHLLPPIAPFLLQWNNGSVKRLAEAAYEHRDLPAGTLDGHRLAVLADALEEAGYQDQDILGHLRGPGPHVRGCWVLDILTGRK